MQTPHDQQSSRDDLESLSAREALQVVVLRRAASVLRDVLSRMPRDVVVRAAAADSDESLLRAVVEMVGADAPDRDRPTVAGALRLLDDAAAARRARAREMIEASGVTVDDLYRSGALPAERARELGAHVEEAPVALDSAETIDQRIAAFLESATSIIGSRTAALEWLVTPHRALGMAAPVALLGTAEGTAQVAVIVERLRPPLAESDEQGKTGATAERPCYACSAGILRLTTVRGRTFDYRGSRVVLDEDLVVPACNACGEMLLGSEHVRQLSAALERLREAALGQTGEERRTEQERISTESVAERIAMVRQRAEVALGERERAASWMTKPNRGLGGVTPEALLATAEGTQAVLAILTRIEHGVVS